jgi:hypothetical protein
VHCQFGVEGSNDKSNVLLAGHLLLLLVWLVWQVLLVKLQVNVEYWVEGFNLIEFQ